MNARVHPAAATEIFSHNQMAITVEPPKPEPGTLRLSGSGICSNGSGGRISDSGFVFSGNISIRCLASVRLNCDFKCPANIVSAAFVEQILLENTSRRTRFYRDSAIYILRLRRSSREKTTKKPQKKQKRCLWLEEGTLKKRKKMKTTTPTHLEWCHRVAVCSVIYEIKTRQGESLQGTSVGG